MNVLICIVESVYSDEWIGNLLSEISPKECIVAFRDGPVATEGIVAKQYATCKCSHSKLTIGDYSQLSSIISDAPPVDIKLLDEMAKYEKQIFWMMERCESVEYNHRWSVYLKHLQVWNYLLEKCNIDVFISTSTPHEVYDFVIYLLCKLKGIKVVTGNPISYYNRSYVFSDMYNPLPDYYNEYDCLTEKYKDISIDDIILRDDISEMYNFYTGSGDRTPYYMKEFEKKKHVGCLWWSDVISNIIDKNYNYAYTVYIWAILYRLFFIFRLFCGVFNFSIKNYKWFEERMYHNRMFHEDIIALSYYKNNTTNVDYKRQYIYVALQMQPENTSSPLGGIFVDQALMVEMLSYYLPKDWIIYVKEHPAQMQQSARRRTSYRTMNFYERLKKCPNVEFVPFNEDTYKLINNAEAMATLTGTVGMEAISKGIPCLMFGYGYMQYAPNVYPIRNNTDCQKVLAYISKPQKVDDEYYKKLKIYFKVLEKYIFKGTTEYYLINDDEQFESKKALTQNFLDKIM